MKKFWKNFNLPLLELYFSSKFEIDSFFRLLDAIADRLFRIFRRTFFNILSSAFVSGKSSGSSTPSSALFWFFPRLVSRILERVLIEHIESIYSSESKLFFVSICSIRIRSRTRDILKKWKNRSWLTICVPHQSSVSWR